MPFRMEENSAIAEEEERHRLLEEDRQTLAGEEPLHQETQRPKNSRNRQLRQRNSGPTL